MTKRYWVPLIGACALLFAAVVVTRAAGSDLLSFRDATGAVATYDNSGDIDQSGAFFQSLGTNGRSCATCHRLDTALSFSGDVARALFKSTSGADPLFADVDGANCPGVNRADPSAHSLILNHGLVRVAPSFPASPEFDVDTIRDPYGCADTVDATTLARQLSVYRRPLPSTNLRFLSAVMWDGRETVAPLTHADTFAANLQQDLTQQAHDATMGHAQASVEPSASQLADIVSFELSLYTAQNKDDAAGSLQAQGATGGPVALSQQTYYPGINDSLGSNPTGAPFTSEAFTIFKAWTDLPGSTSGPITVAREAVAAGEAIFNSFPLTITGVGGLNDALGQASIRGTCTTCHDAPNVGHHSLPVPLDIGVSHASDYEADPLIRAALAQLSPADLPVYRVTCTSGPAAGTTVFTTDPGKALISGKCSDLNRVKGPILRGLSARAPYFHNGAAATLREVVEFYNERFQMNLTDQEKDQLVAFLRTL